MRTILVRSNSRWYGSAVSVEGLVNDGTVPEAHLARAHVDARERVLAPVLLKGQLRLPLKWLLVVKLVHAILKVLASVGTATFLSCGRRVDRHERICHQVLQLERLNKVRIPDQTAVTHLWEKKRKDALLALMMESKQQQGT